MCFHLAIAYSLLVCNIHTWKHMLWFMHKLKRTSDLSRLAQKTHKHTHMVCSLQLLYSGGAPTCPRISVQGIFWHRKYIISAQTFCSYTHTHTHSQKHTQLLPFSKSTHSQMGHALELKSGAVKKTKQGERRV